MSESPKKGKDFKRVSISLALIALQRLSDPEVRAQLAKQGRSISASAKEWRAERSGRRSELTAGGVHPSPPGLSDRFGRRKLERRVQRLRASVLNLGEGRPELARSLDPVLAALEEVTSAIDVAELMPLPKRVRAHQRIDRVLNELEGGLFEAALPQLRG